MIMREIKFRAKDEKGNFKIGYFSKDFCGYSYITELSGKDFYLVEPNTLGQFTGLKDKNGIEIYEGDIVNSNYFKNASVVFWRYGWHFNTGKDNHHSFNTASHSFEVIGNIHENPELLCTSQST